jgi:hypothetical protein
MSPEQENFEQLRRLLVLKRYEQPPPGYFNRFSGEVIARITVLEAEPAATLFQRMGHSGWVQRFWALLEARPVLAGAMGAAFCGLLVSGVAYSDHADPKGMMASPLGETGPISSSMADLRSGHPDALRVIDQSSTAPETVKPGPPSLFQQIHDLQQQQPQLGAPQQAFFPANN